MLRKSALALTDDPARAAVAAEALSMLEHADAELAGVPSLSAVLRPGEAAALAAVDAAELQLVRAASPSEQFATLSSVLRRARDELPDGNAARERLERLTTGRRPGDGELVEAIIAALQEAADRRRRALDRMSVLSTRVMIAAGFGFVAVTVLAFIGLCLPAAWSVCFQPAPGLDICPTGSRAAPVDLILVQLAGLAGALAGAILTARPLRDVALPTRLAVPATALKLLLGALLAPAVLLLISHGFVPGLDALDSRPQIFGWSAAIGFGQQAFTAALDRRLIRLGRRTSRWYESVLPVPAPAVGRPPPPLDRPAPVHRYRVLCLGITLVGMALAFVPLALVLDRSLPLTAGAGAAALVAVQGIRRSPRRRAPSPQLAFLVSASAGAARCAAVAALLVLTAVLITSGVTDSAAVTALVSGGTAAVAGLIVGAEIQADLGRRLLGGNMQPGPVLMPRLRRRSIRYAVSAAGLVALIVAAVTHPAPTAAVWTGLGSLAALDLATAFRRRSRPPARSHVEDAGELRDELVSAGWRVVADPQFGSPQVDPLLGRVDLLLRQEGQALAVQIHRGGPDRKTGWRAASELMVATNALKRLMDDSAVGIAPVMVLVDTEPDASLEELAVEGPLRIVEIRQEAGRRFPVQLREKLAGVLGTTAASQG